MGRSKNGRWRGEEGREGGRKYVVITSFTVVITLSPSSFIPLLPLFSLISSSRPLSHYQLVITISCSFALSHFLSSLLSLPSCHHYLPCSFTRLLLHQTSAPPPPRTLVSSFSRPLSITAFNSVRIFSHDAIPSSFIKRKLILSISTSRTPPASSASFLLPFYSILYLLHDLTRHPSLSRCFPV